MPSRLVIGAMFLYGVGLGFFAFVLGAGGDGIFTPLCVAMSPPGIFLIAVKDSASPLAQNLVGIPLLLAGSIQWGVLGLLQRRYRLKRVYSAGFILLHYGVAAYLIAGPYGDDAIRWAGARQFEMRSLAVAIAWYLAGQILVWSTVVRSAPAGIEEKLRA